MRTRTYKSAHDLNVFGDALRECLGLEPLHQNREEPKTWRTELERFYVVHREVSDGRTRAPE